MAEPKQVIVSSESGLAQEIVLGKHRLRADAPAPFRTLDRLPTNLFSQASALAHRSLCGMSEPSDKRRASTKTSRFSSFRIF